MRIGIDLISDSGRPSGIHSYTNALLEALLEACESGLDGASDYSFVIFQNDDFSWRSPIGNSERVTMVHSGRRNLSAAHRRVLQQSLVPKLARRHRVDVVHSFNNVLPLHLPVPGVVTVHDLSPFVLPGRFGLVKRSFLRWAVPRSIRRANAVITGSESTRGAILRQFSWVPFEKIHIIPHAVDKRFHCERSSTSESQLRNQYQLPEEFALSVGAAEPGKNLAMVTRGLEIAKEHYDIVIPWVVVGNQGSYHRALERDWRRSPVASSIVPLGVVSAEDLVTLYRMATTFVFASRYEGFGLPLLEAFASGTPAIISSDPALTEVSGRAAYIVDAENPEAIARGIVKVWKHREIRELLRARGLRRVCDFSWKNAAHGSLNVYREVVSGSGQAATAAPLPALGSIS